MGHRMQSHQTADRGPPVGTVPIGTVEQIGPRRKLLPNGNLLCEAVPIARVGWMLYGPGETPIEVDPSRGTAYVHRDAEALFSPETIASFMGAAVTDDHPDDFVNERNWNRLSHGMALTNVRRGEGEDDDLLVADLLITSQSLIDSIMANKREVSAGYEADYTQTGIGQGKQTKLLGNHIALVERGRCGPRCAIGDRDNTRKENEMPMQRTKLLPATSRRAELLQTVTDAQAELDTLEEDTQRSRTGDTVIHIHNGSKGKTRDAEGDKDEDDEDDEAKKKEKGDKTADSLKVLGEQLKATNDTVAKLADAVAALAKTKDSDDPDKKDDDEEEEDDDKKKDKTGDSAALSTSYQKTLASAEILVPGFRMPAFDSKAKRKATVDAMCQARRRALDLCYATKDGKDLVDAIHGAELTIDTMGCADVATLFNAAAAVRGAKNNRAGTGDRAAPPVNEQPVNATQAIASIAKRAGEFWASKQ